MSILPLADAYQTAVDDVATLAIADTVNVLNELEGATVAETAGVLRQTLPELTATYGEAAGVITTQYYNEVRATSSSLTTEYTPVVQSSKVVDLTQDSIGFTAAQLSKGVQYGTVISTLAGSVQRIVNGVGRDTLAWNVVKDPDGTLYKRVPNVDACAFCRTMAAVAKPSNEYYVHFHNNCRCRSVPVFRGQEVPSFPGDEETKKAYALAGKELERQRKEARKEFDKKLEARGLYTGGRAAGRAFLAANPELTYTTKNYLRLMRQITGWR